MKVVELVPDKLVRWQCVVGPDEWIDTLLTFELKPNGAETFLVPSVAHTDDMVRQVEVALREITRCQVGDLVVIVAGSPPGTPGRTNALRVHRIGDAIDS